MLWATSADGSNDYDFQSIAVDVNGNSYITGNINGNTIKFGNTTLIDTSISFHKYIDN